MAKSPVSVERVECQDGKRRTVVREREYDLRSWQGIKTLGTIILSVGGIIVAVLTAYYTAEASQNGRMSQQGQELSAHKQRLNDNDKNINKAFEQFSETLKEQRKALDKNTEAVIRIDTRQEVLIERIKTLDAKIDKAQ